jgi:AraC-like DNA-binding protein
VSVAAAAACLSERQLSRRFRERIGVPPKVFARVMRLQCARAALARGMAASTAAAYAGYADQAHFTREASELAGVTPRVLARELAPRATNTSDSFKTTAAAAS